MNIYIHGYFDNNLGDDLMIKMVSKHFQDHNFYILSDNSIIYNTFLHCSNIKILPTKEKKTLFEKIDLYLTIGGSIFNNLNNKKGQVSRMLRIRELKKVKRKNIKIATIGCNLGPYNNRIGVELTKQELRLSDLVTVRDTYSYDLIKKHSMSNNFYKGHDIVTFLNKEEFLGQNEIDDTPIYGLGVSAYRSIKNQEINRDLYIDLAKVIDEFIDNNNEKVALYCFDTENENDLVAAYHIKNLSKNENKIDIIPYIGNESIFLKEFNKAKKHITIRFHAAILSALLQKPHLILSYSNKHNNYFNENSDYFYNLDSLKKVNPTTLLNSLYSFNREKLEINKEKNIHFDMLEGLIDEIQQSLI